MDEATPTEKTLTEAIQAMVDEDPQRVAGAISEALESRAVRCLLVTTRAGGAPSVAITLTINDVTSEAVRRVVTPVLRKAGVSEEAIPMMSGVAGTAVSGWLAKQREKQRAAAAPRPVEPEGSWAGPPKWSPGRRRSGG